MIDRRLKPPAPLTNLGVRRSRATSWKN